MATRRKKSNRRYRRGRTYFCAKCGYYSWLENPSQVVRDMWDVSGNGVKAVSRTCRDCRRSP